MKDEPIIIVKDTIPDTFIGVPFKRRFGSGFAFTFDEVKKDILYFQVQPFLQILRHDTQKLLFEFRGFCNYFFKYRIEDKEFYDEALKLNLNAIDQFNRKIKLKKSTLTVHQSYTPIPKLEQAKPHIRGAYFIKIFDNRPSRN